MEKNTKFDLVVGDVAIGIFWEVATALVVYYSKVDRYQNSRKWMKSLCDVKPQQSLILISKMIFHIFGDAKV